MSREDWLRKVVEYLDSDLFNGDLDLLNHEFQIACGRCPGKKLTECIQPSDNENIGLDDFFPTTIHVNFTIKDPKEIIGNLALECIHAFFSIKGCNKKFKSLANKYYFEPPYNEYCPSAYLQDIIDGIYKKMIKNYGDWPGKAISFPVKEKSKSSNAYILFCPECGYELKMSKKTFKKYNGGLPTCPCGVKMAINNEDLEDEQQEES